MDEKDQSQLTQLDCLTHYFFSVLLVGREEEWLGGEGEKEEKYEYSVILRDFSFQMSSLCKIIQNCKTCLVAPLMSSKVPQL